MFVLDGLSLHVRPILTLRAIRAWEGNLFGAFLPDHRTAFTNCLVYARIASIKDRRRLRDARLIHALCKELWLVCNVL